MSQVLSLRDVRRTYDEPPVAACAGVGLAVERGEFIAIAGPSGSGKSALLNLVKTLDHPTSDTAEIDRIDVLQLSDRKLSALRAHLIGFVSQQSHLSGDMNAIGNVADGLLYLGIPRAERRQRAEAALVHAGLSHRLYHKPHQTSGGERQHVAVARVVVGDPPLLLIDEPTGNLDSVSGASIVELLHELHERGTTIVVIAHDNDPALQLLRQVAIRDGRIVHNPAAKEMAHV